MRSELVEIPEPPRNYKAKDIRQIRETRCYSQVIFAKILNVSIKNGSIMGIRKTDFFS